MATQTALRWSVGPASDAVAASGIERPLPVAAGGGLRDGRGGIGRARTHHHLRPPAAVVSELSYIIVSLTLAIPAMILGETALSFLGLGIQPPAVSWGTLLQDAQNFQAVASQPWLLIPCLFVVLTVLLYNFLGDGLRDAADPYS